MVVEVAMVEVAIVEVAVVAVGVTEAGATAIADRAPYRLQHLPYTPPPFHRRSPEKFLSTKRQRTVHFPLLPRRNL